MTLVSKIYSAAQAKPNPRHKKYFERTLNGKKPRRWDEADKFIAQKLRHKKQKKQKPTAKTKRPTMRGDEFQQYRRGELTLLKHKPIQTPVTNHDILQQANEFKQRTPPIQGAWERYSRKLTDYYEHHPIGARTASRAQGTPAQMSPLGQCLRAIRAEAEK